MLSGLMLLLGRYAQSLLCPARLTGAPNDHKQTGVERADPWQQQLHVREPTTLETATKRKSQFTKPNSKITVDRKARGAVGMFKRQVNLKS